MPGAGNAVVKAITKYGPRVVKYAPGALVFVTKFLQDHPTVPDWTKQRLTDVADRLRRLRPGDAEQIQGKLAIVRDEVAKMDDVPAALTGGWLKRAANIEHGANLASKLGKPEQKKTLGSLREQADALLAEVIAAIAYSPANPPEPAAE
jgi:hypothetical protein